jgi:hypothetical protein
VRFGLSIACRVSRVCLLSRFVSLTHQPQMFRGHHTNTNTMALHDRHVGTRQRTSRQSNWILGFLFASSRSFSCRYYNNGTSTIPGGQLGCSKPPALVIWSNRQTDCLGKGKSIYPGTCIIFCGWNEMNEWMDCSVSASGVCKANDDMDELRRKGKDWWWSRRRFYPFLGSTYYYWREKKDKRETLF